MTIVRWQWLGLRLGLRLGLAIGLIGSGKIQIVQATEPPILAESIATDPMAQLNSVSQLTDVKPTDWAFQALQSLVERYGCITGYPDQTFRGLGAMTRYEFAAGLNVCIDSVNQRIASNTQTIATNADLETLKKLQTDFATELSALQSSLAKLEPKVNILEKQQFSTTTKLTGQVVMALNAGGFTGDQMIAPLGATISTQQPQTTAIYRASFDLNTSFTGQDLLKVRLVTGSRDARDNAAGFLEPNLGSTLDFSIPGRDSRLSLARLYYTFTPLKDVLLTIGPQLVAPDFIDKNRYANVSFLDFSTQALVNTFVLLPRPGGAGIVLDWKPKRGPFKVRGLYVAGDPANLLPENQQVIGGGRRGDILVFPTAGGGAEGGFFGDPFQGFVEVEYSPTPALNLRLQGAGGRYFGSPFIGGGINFDLALGKKLGVFGRYAKASYSNTSLNQDIEPQYWSAGLILRDSFRAGDLAGVAMGQPLITSVVGDATQTNFELFYNFPVNRNLRITPLLQVITHPGNREANDTIVSGTIRTVFLF